MPDHTYIVKICVEYDRHEITKTITARCALLAAVLAAADLFPSPRDSVLSVHVWEAHDLAAGYIIRTDSDGNLESIE